jgi:hypothetical protein
MPRGNPKRIVMHRIDPELFRTVQALTTNVTAAIEEGLRLWIARARRQRRDETRSKIRDSRKGAA